MWHVARKGLRPADDITLHTELVYTTHSQKLYDPTNQHVVTS